MKSERGEPRVLLLAMPWNRWDYPSIQVGLLKAYLRAHGVAAQARYPYLDLARRLGAETYNRLADKLPPLLAESFFTVGIHGEDPLPKAWVAELVATGELDDPQVRSIAHAVRAFLDAFYDAIPWQDWDVVGLTCTFNQVFASLALAERIKRNHPGVRIVFGGSNLHGQLGQAVMENFPCIDCVISGPGEEALLRYARRETPAERVFLDGSSDPAVAPVVPDYEEYFAGLPDEWRPVASVVAIASRGCHYGRCVFCAQNLEPGREVYPADWVGACLGQLLSRHGRRRVEFADTAFPVSLLDSDHGEGLGREAAGMFAEFTAGLSERQFDQIHRAGFDTIQVGIESFHSGVLRRMVKPADLLTNVRCLKLAYERGIEVGYNLILDFPSTTPAELEEMLGLLPWLFHLPPPTALVPFQLQHSAPILDQAGAYGLTDIRPHRHYPWLDARFEAGGLAPFYLEFRNRAPLPTHLLEQAHSLCVRWHERYGGDASLHVQPSENGRLVVDRRGDTERRFELRGLAVSILDGTRRLRLERKLRLEWGRDPAFDRTLDQLVKLGLVLRDAGKLLALPTRQPSRRPVLDPLESYFAPEEVAAN
jgi:ribosomal peptide maturation radical SAM protein 1